MLWSNPFTVTIHKIKFLFKTFFSEYDSSVAVFRSVILYLTNLCAQCGELSILIALLPLAFSKSLRKTVSILACGNHSPEMSWQSFDKLSKSLIFSNSSENGIWQTTYIEHIRCSCVVPKTCCNHFSCGTAFKFVELFRIWGSYCPKHYTNVVKFWQYLCVVHWLTL